MTLLSIFRRATPMVFVAASLMVASCSLFKEGPDAEKARVNAEKADAHYVDAGNEYDKGNYVASYDYSRKAFDLDNEIQSELLMGWSLVHLRRFEDFTFQNNGTRGRGAVKIFKDILKDSPNEFRARLGLATVGFYQHYDLAKKVKIFSHINRGLTTFMDLMAPIPNNPNDARNHPTTLDFIRKWESAGGFAERYRGAHNSGATLWADPENESAKVSGNNWPGWAAESLSLDSIPYLIRNGYLVKASAKLQELQRYNKSRGDYWEKRSIAKLERALREFHYLEGRREGKYHYILRDIGLAHIAIANFYLQKEIDRARRHVRTQAWWHRVPEIRRDEVLLAFLQDPKRFPSKDRVTMNNEFKAGETWLTKFIEADVDAERTRYENVNERELAAQANTESDYIDHENLQLHKKAVAIFQAEQSNQRKRIILQVLTLMIYPQYGIEDLSGALALTNTRLDVTDINDPIAFLIRGIIYQRSEEWENAKREFSLYITKASIATDGPRITQAREARTLCELKIEEAHRRGE